jgi:hypothetical protein
MAGSLAFVMDALKAQDWDKLKAALRDLLTASLTGLMKVHLME